MLFAIDIGNSNIHIGFFEDDKLLHTFRLGSDKKRTADEYAILIKSITELGGYKTSDFEGVIIGSVVPALTNIIQNAVSSITNAHILTVGPGIKTGFPIKIDSPSELGADLAANAAGAIAKCGAPCVIIDFGTATAISVIDENKAYIGGIIMPGIQMSLDALQNTGLLPGIPADSPVSLLGKNTKDSMQAGVIRGSVYSVLGFAHEYKESFLGGKEANLIVTGGFASYALPYIQENKIYSPGLTLEGLNIIYTHNKNKVIPRAK